MGVVSAVACAVLGALAMAAMPIGTAHAQDEDELIPAWIRQIFVYYADEQISDAEMIAALTYLIDNGIIVAGGSAPAPAAPAPAPSTTPAVNDAYIMASDVGMSAIADASVAIRAIEDAVDLDVAASEASSDAVRISNSDAVFRAAERADPSDYNAVIAADAHIQAAIALASTGYIDGGIETAIEDISELTDSAILAGSSAAAHPYGSSSGAMAQAKAAKAWIKVFDAQASLATDRVSSLSTASVDRTYGHAADAYVAIGANRAAKSLDRAGDAWADAAVAWALAAETARDAAASWEATADAWTKAADAAAGSTGAGTGTAKAPAIAPRNEGSGTGADRMPTAGSSGATGLSASERAVERARIVALQDSSGPRECYTLLRSMERNLMEQDGAESQIKYLRDYLAFAPDPNDPALQQSRSLLDSSTENLRGLQADYQTMKSTYESYSQCR